MKKIGQSISRTKSMLESTVPNLPTNNPSSNLPETDYKVMQSSTVPRHWILNDALGIGKPSYVRDPFDIKPRTQVIVRTQPLQEELQLSGVSKEENLPPSPVRVGLYEPTYLEEERNEDYESEADTSETEEGFNQDLEAVLSDIYSPRSKALQQAKYAEYYPVSKVEIVPHVSYKKFSKSRVLLTAIQLLTDVIAYHKQVKEGSYSVGKTSKGYARYKNDMQEEVRVKDTSHLAKKRYDKNDIQEDVSVQEEKVVFYLKQTLERIEKFLLDDAVRIADKEVLHEEYQRIQEHKEAIEKDLANNASQGSNNVQQSQERLEELLELLSGSVANKYISGGEASTLEFSSGEENKSQEKVQENEYLDLQSIPVVEEKRVRGIGKSTKIIEDKAVLLEKESIKNRSSFFAQAVSIPVKRNTQEQSTQGTSSAQQFIEKIRATSKESLAQDNQEASAITIEKAEEEISIDEKDTAFVTEKTIAFSTKENVDVSSVSHIEEHPTIPHSTQIADTSLTGKINVAVKGREDIQDESAVKEEENLLNRVKRHLEDPILPYQALQQLGYNLLVKDTETSGLFAQINQEIRNSPTPDLWKNPDFLNKFQELFDKAKVLINMKGQKPHIATSSINLEIFSQLNAHWYYSIPEYARIFFNFVDPPYSGAVNVDCTFLPLHMAGSSAEDKALFYTLLHFLEQHPSINLEIYAKLAGEVHYQFKQQNEAYLHQKFLDNFLSEEEIQTRIQTENQFLDIPDPVFYNQSLDLWNKQYLTDYGFCYPLASAFLYYAEQFGIKNAPGKMKILMETMDKIHKLPYQESLEYQKGIVLFASEFQRNGVETKGLPRENFSSEEIFLKNQQQNLSTDTILDCLFDPGFALDKKYFYLRGKTHIISVIRTFQYDPIIDSFAPIIHYFDANYGLLATSSKEIMRDIFVNAGVSPDNFIISDADPMAPARYINRAGGEFMDILTYNIIGNPKLRVPILENEHNFSDANINFITTQNKKVGKNVDLQILLREHKRHIEYLQILYTYCGLQYLQPLTPDIDIFDIQMYDSLIAHLQNELDNSSMEQVINSIKNISTEIARNINNIQSTGIDFSSQSEYFENFSSILTKTTEQVQNFEDLSSFATLYTDSLTTDDSSLVPLDALATNLLDIDPMDDLDDIDLYSFDNDGALGSPLKKDVNVVPEVTKWSIKELEGTGIFDFEESKMIKNLMVNFDNALETLLITSELDPNEYIPVEWENIKKSATTLEECTMLTREYIDVVRIQDNTIQRLPIQDTKMKAIGKQLHKIISNFNQKVQAFNKKMDIPYKGLTFYFTACTLSAAQSMMDQGKVFHLMNTFDKTKYITNTTDATSDVATNVAGAVNKIVKTFNKPLSTLSKISRFSSKVSGFIGVAASGVRFGVSAVEYSQNPNKMNELTLIFDGLDLGFSLAMAVYPASAIVLVPLNVILDFVRQDLQRAIRIEEVRKYLDEMMEQLEMESDGITKRKTLIFRNGVATVETASGDIVKITMKEGNKLELTLTANSGKGFHIYPRNHATPNNPIVPQNTQHVTPLEEGIVFPNKECVSKAAVHKTTVCLSEKLQFFQEFCQKKYSAAANHDFYSVSSKNTPLSYKDMKTKTNAVITEEIPVKQPINAFYLQQQFITYKKVQEYMFRSEDLSANAIVDMSIRYRDKDSIHRLAQCSNFDAVRTSKLKIQGGGENFYYQDVLVGRKHERHLVRGFDPQFLFWDYVASYLSNCFVIGRNTIDVDFSQVENPPMIILPETFVIDKSKIAPYVPDDLKYLESKSTLRVVEKGTYISFTEPSAPDITGAIRRYTYSLDEEFKPAAVGNYYFSGKKEYKVRIYVPFPEEHIKTQIMRQLIGCDVEKNVRISEHAEYRIYSGVKEAIQIIIQGKNNVILYPSKKEEGSSKTPGFILFAEESMKKNHIQIREYPGASIILGDTRIDLQYVDEKTPVFLRGEGFVLEWNSIEKRLQPVLYDPKIKAEQKGYENISSKPTGKELAKTLYKRLSALFYGEKYFQEYTFPVKGIELTCEDSQNKTKTIVLHNTIYLYRKQVLSRVIYIHLPKILSKELESIDYNDFSLFHVEEDLYDYPEVNKQYSADPYTAYFYNEKTNTMIIQKGDKDITLEDIIQIKEKPEFIICADGKQRLLINGTVSCYDTNGYPIEQRIKADVQQLIIEDIDTKIHAVMQRMKEGQNKEAHDERSIIISNIPYKTHSGKIYPLTIQKSLKKPTLSLFIPEYQGKELSLLTKPIKALDDIYYSYYTMCDKSDPSKQSIIVFPAIGALTRVIEDGFIQEEKLPSPTVIFEDITIDKYYATGDSLTFKTKEGLFLQAILNGKDSYTRVLQISEEYLQKQGYDISKPVSVQIGILETELLYGKSYANMIEISNAFGESSIADKRTGIVLPTNKNNFYKPIASLHRSTILAKPITKRNVRSVENEAIEESSTEWKKSPDLFVQGYTVNKETGVRTVYMWDKASQILLASPENPTEDRPPQSYNLAYLVEGKGEALLAFSDTHTQEKNRGIVLPGSPKITIESAQTAKTIALVYTEEDLVYVDELTLKHKVNTERLPQFIFITQSREYRGMQIPSLIVKSMYTSKDIYLHILKSDSIEAKPEYTRVILKGFFTHNPTMNPYNNVITVNGKSYSATELLEKQKVYEEELPPIQEERSEITEEEDSMIL